ncbi:MAG TPA: sugar ABC transporter ATP-binding protein [Microbacteriaceae bacterium]|nr:sugar ABC transporter ATP-binding protein [Microbacteriaceae bacterium]
MTAANEPLLRITGMVKEFPGLRALDDVSLEVNAGEIVAVVGHNGSGKSTLVKILAGVYTRDAGEVEYPASTAEEETGLHIIHQDLGLALQLNAIENLGIPKYKGLRASLSLSPVKREKAQARELISRFGEPFDVTVPVGQLAPAQRSIIGIARALDGWKHPRNILILDEPTEALHASEVRVLFAAVKKLAAEGAGIIFISHRLDEVLELADRIVVLRDGKKVADDQRSTIDHDQLVAYVTGIEAGEAETGRTDRTHGEVVLDIDGLWGEVLDGIDLRVHAGEVVGVAGVLGSGREALPAMVFGSMLSAADEFNVAGSAYPKRTPAESIKRGMAFVPGDRGKYGAIRDFNARENMTLPAMQSVTNAIFSVNVRKEKELARELVVKYDVKPPRAEQIFKQFSGGNQQKIVFAKWLRNDPSVLLLEEPTQGVDIGAKQALYDAIDDAAARGAAVLVCSSEAKELVRLCDRVLVLRDGRVSVELSGEDLTETRLVLEGYGLADDHVAGGSEEQQ